MVIDVLETFRSHWGTGARRDLPQGPQAHSGPQASANTHTYICHFLAGSKIFRKWVGGRWEHWVYFSRNASLNEVTFWVRTGDGVQTPFLRPGAGVKVDAEETWVKKRRR